MADTSTQDRTEAASPRRREEAREQGKVAISQDLNQAILLLIALGLLWFVGPDLGDSMQSGLRRDLSDLATDEWTIAHTVVLVQQLTSRVVHLLLPITTIMAVTAFGVNVAQAGLRFTWEPLAPNFSRLDMTQGFSRILSARTSLRALMLLIKLTLGMGFAIWYLYRNRADVQTAGMHNLYGAIHLTWRFALLTCFSWAGILFAMGLIDFLYQRWQYEQDLMMSKQEQKDELKREDGDPMMRGRMRKFARESIKNQMIKKVPEATVILTNPTHIAVAIKYDRETMTAPKVIAKGTDLFAKRIIRVAQQHGVPVLERKPLARALYASVNVDDEIPPNLYRAIAEILAYIYGLKKSG